MFYALGVSRQVGRLIEKQLRARFTRFREKIGTIIVRVGNVNRPKGGVDRRCRLLVRTHGKREIVINDRDADLYIAIDRAASRAGRALGRAIGRSRIGQSRRLAQMIEPAA